MISLIYQKRCESLQLEAEIAMSTGIVVHVFSWAEATTVRTYVPLNQTQKDSITALVAAHVPDTTFTEEMVALP